MKKPKVFWRYLRISSHHSHLDVWTFLKRIHRYLLALALIGVLVIVFLPTLMHEDKESSNIKRGETVEAILPSSDLDTGHLLSPLLDLHEIEEEPADTPAAKKPAATLQAAGAKTNLKSILGFTLLLSCFLYLFTLYVRRYQPDILDRESRLMFIYLIVLTSIITAKVISFVPGLPNFFIPVAAFSMLVAILLNERVALFLTIFISLLISILVGGTVETIVFYLGGGMAGIYAVASARTRSDLTKTGIVVSGANIGIIIAYGLIYQYPYFGIGIDCLWGIGNGFLSAVLTIGVLPFMERIFGLVTNFRLLELADLNTPLLKKLLIQASGTHHHSIVVANLAETAAEEVGANPLLARVAAYYHDVGKIAKPEYFSENKSEESKHKDIKPSLSASVLRSHVKEGVEIAKSHGLPQRITDIIRQHHGTSVMAFFYHLAKERQEEEKQTANASDFRYPGPKPQTREAAIIMLADAVEAASRTLTKPTALRLEEMVKRIINDKFISSELDECELTLKDMTKIAATFTRLLTGIYHSRVEYPNEADEK